MSTTDANRTDRLETVHAESLGAFIDASPSPYHAVENAGDRLASAGFSEVSETASWEGVHAGFVRRGGALVAWRCGSAVSPTSGFRLIGAHTDSPNLRIKPNPDHEAAGVAQLGVEIYGGVLLNSWLDRDLGLSGRVVIAGEGGALEQRLVLVDEPTLRVPQLAIHLHREINTEGLLLNKQEHMSPMWAASVPAGSFRGWLASVANVDPDRIRGWDVMTHDLTPAAILGADRAFLAAPRIDNLASCFAGLEALLDDQTAADTVSVLCLFDHEEVGSVSSSGAASTFLPQVVERINSLLGGDAATLPRSLAASACISADGAHATHPNYFDRHEPDHQIVLNGGPVIKRNSNERYATNAMGQAIAVESCRAAGVPFQVFVNRTDLACGSTIGPATAAALGITTIDMGLSQLSMHSAREICGAADPAMLRAALSAFLAAEEF